MWNTECKEEKELLARLNGEEGFTICAGLHVVRERIEELIDDKYKNNIPKSTLRYNVLAYLSDNNDDYLPCTMSVFKQIRAELYKAATETDPDLVGPLLTFCSFCLKNTIHKCAHCELAYYCGELCQKKAWPKHRAFCHDGSGTIGVYFAFDLLCRE